MLKIIHENISEVNSISKPQGNSLLPVDEFGSDFFYSMNTVQGQFPSLDLPPLDTEMQVLDPFQMLQFSFSG